MQISDIHFHDTQILSVIENTEKDLLTMIVMYPVDWDSNHYELRHLIFSDSHSYQVTEIPFSGAPTILDASIIATDSRWSIIRLETNAGYREVTCISVKLEKP